MTERFLRSPWLWVFRPISTIRSSGYPQFQHLWKSFGTFLSPQITTEITVLHSVLSSLARYKYLSLLSFNLIFTLLFFFLYLFSSSFFSVCPNDVSAHTNHINLSSFTHFNVFHESSNRGIYTILDSLLLFLFLTHIVCLGHLSDLWHSASSSTFLPICLIFFHWQFWEWFRLSYKENWPGIYPTDDISAAELNFMMFSSFFSFISVCLMLSASNISNYLQFPNSPSVLNLSWFDSSVSSVISFFQFWSWAFFYANFHSYILVLYSCW